MKIGSSVKISMGVLIGVVLAEVFDYPATILIIAAVVLFVITLIFSFATSTKSGENKSNSGQVKGTVKWFNNSKGFGFIVQEGGGDVFVHNNSIIGNGRKTLREGQKVTMKVSQDKKGPQAKDVICQ